MPEVVRRRYWVILTLLVAGYLVVGMVYSHIGITFEEWLIRVGFTGGVVIPLVLVWVYSRTAQWWRNDVGAGMCQCALAVSYLSLPFCYAFWADAGVITPSFWGWMAVSGPALVSLAILRLAWVFYRKLRRQHIADAESEREE